MLDVRIKCELDRQKKIAYSQRLMKASCTSYLDGLYARDRR